MVLNEVLRVYSVGWAVPRMASADTEIGGVPIRSGSTMLLSPYLTHRLPEFWPDPEHFDPERFTPAQIRRRHPYAYLPFGSGEHVCLGQNFFEIEATLIVAAILSRYRVTVRNLSGLRPQLTLTLQPAGAVELQLTPR
jgi:cytochrome P450